MLIATDLAYFITLWMLSCNAIPLLCGVSVTEPLLTRLRT